MVREPLPRSLKKAIERLEAEPERPWRRCDLASACGIFVAHFAKALQTFSGVPCADILASTTLRTGTTGADWRLRARQRHGDRDAVRFCTSRTFCDRVPSALWRKPVGDSAESSARKQATHRTNANPYD
jgi:hypothetical protein